MKILGENSLSSKVEGCLKILFCMIALLDVAVLIICSITLFSEYNSISMIENNLARIILITIISLVFLSTGIVALFIIYHFIKIFKNLKKNQLFEKQNVKYLKNISKSSSIMGILYFIVLIGVKIILENYILLDMLSDLLIKILIFVFSIIFLAFGIGIKILNEIYMKAIEYKEENDFTI